MYRRVRELEKLKQQKLIEMNSQGIDEELIESTIQDIQIEIDHITSLIRDELKKLGCPPERIEILIDRE